MFDGTPATDATRTLASAIPPEPLAAVRRWRTGVAVRARAAQLRADLLELEDDASHVRAATTRKARTTRANVAWRRRDDIAVKRTWLAMKFAQRHGLHHTRHEFGPAALAQGALIVPDDGGRAGGLADAWPYPEGDHIDLFERNGRAAAAVAHVYSIGTSPADVRAMCAAFATRAGLRVTFPRYPSWWAPGETLLVAYWPHLDEGTF